MASLTLTFDADADHPLDVLSALRSALDIDADSGVQVELTGSGTLTITHEDPEPADDD